MQHFVESMHFEQLQKKRILWRTRTNQNEVPILTQTSLRNTMSRHESRSLPSLERKIRSRTHA